MGMACGLADAKECCACRSGGEECVLLLQWVMVKMAGEALLGRLRAFILLRNYLQQKHTHSTGRVWHAWAHA